MKELCGLRGRLFLWWRTRVFTLIKAPIRPVRHRLLFFFIFHGTGILLYLPTFRALHSI
jgi:hypothetical protein